MTDLEILRAVLVRELETINEYTSLSRLARDPTVRDLLIHISRDEEEHVAECIQWISRLNPVMAGFLARSPDHVPHVAPGGAGTPEAEPAARAASSASPAGVAVAPPAGPQSGMTGAPVATLVGGRVGGPVGALVGGSVGASIPAPTAASVAPQSPLGGLLLSPSGLTVGTLLSRPVGKL